MPKDNEKIQLPDFVPVTPSEPKSFDPDQMVLCEKCLRSSPPTRSNCIYCDSPLPFNEKAAEIQKPALRPLESWESGYNNILVDRTQEFSAETSQLEAAKLLKLNIEPLKTILSASQPLPVARTASLEESLLVQKRLSSLGLTTCVIADEELARCAGAAMRASGLELDEERLRAKSPADGESSVIEWTQLRLLVTGRIVVRRFEYKEQKGRRENEIVAASELFSDEAVLDIYGPNLVCRIMAHSFDFSCLKRQKTLTANENFSLLLGILRQRSPHAVYDDSYIALRQVLESVWPAEQQVESQGWRREGLGKFSLGGATETSNEPQFTRYSRLRSYLTQVRQ